MSEVKDRYRRQRLPGSLAAELEDEFARQAQPGRGTIAGLDLRRWRAAGVAALFVMIAIGALQTLSPTSDPVAEQYAASEKPSTRISPAALTARTSALGQLSVSRLSLPSNTNLAGVTSMPVLPPAPPGSLLRESTTRRKS